MSDIKGEGYGSLHNWKKITSTQASHPIRNSRLYNCVDCGDPFRYYYNAISNIFEAMKENGVKEKCKKEKV